MENLTIKITGGGSREDISKALVLISKSMIHTPIEDLDGCEWEDCTLMTEISVESMNDQKLTKVVTDPDEITKEDIKTVAGELGIVILESEVTWVLECYRDSYRQDPTATWNLIVENLIYQLPRFN